MVGFSRAAVMGLLAVCVMGVTALGDVDGKPNLAGASVSLPLSELKGLLEKSEVDRAPVDYVLGASNVVVAVEGKTAVVETDLQVTLLEEKWVLVPVGPAGGVTAVTVDKAPALLVQKAGVLCVLLKGKAKSVAQVHVSSEKKVVLEGPVSKLDLGLPPSPVVAVTATVKGGMEMKAVGGSGTKVSESGGKTVLISTFQGEQAAGLSWRAKPAAGAEAAAKLSANTLTRVEVGRGVVRYRAEIHYEIQHAEVESFKMTLPEGVEFTKATGEQVREATVTGEGKAKTLTVNLAEAAHDGYVLTVLYEQRFEEKDGAAVVGLIKQLDVTGDQGSVGLEVHGGGYEMVPTVAGAQRVDVRELPEGLWTNARSPLLFGYRYDSPKDVKISLALTKHAEVDVLVAMSDVCEAATTVTSDGKSITKAMYITRNNLKQFMTLKLPEGAQLWSAFVDDRPVTPVKNGKGEVLIPLKKSETVDPDDEKSYLALREARREEGVGDVRKSLHELRKMREVAEDEPADLKPYDVEIVYVMPAVKLEEKGTLKLGLPQSDVPVGKVAWAVFLPSGLRVVDTTGNMNEVGAFTLKFRHFAEAMMVEKEVVMAQKMAQDATEADMAQELAEKAKAQGVLPVRVEIPVSGEITRYEKLLMVDEAPAVVVSYRRKGM